MAPPQKAGLRAMTAEEQAALQRLSKARSERVDRVRWAAALVAIAQGEALAAAAREAGFRSGSAVAALVERFNSEDADVVSDGDGPAPGEGGRGDGGRPPDGRKRG